MAGQFRLRERNDGFTQRRKEQKAERRKEAFVIVPGLSRFHGRLPFAPLRFLFFAPLREISS
jgi:hypothetical protein